MKVAVVCGGLFFSVTLAGCSLQSLVGMKPDDVIVKVVETPKPTLPEECLSKSWRFPKVPRPGVGRVTTPTESAKLWKSAKVRHRNNAIKYRVCREFLKTHFAKNLLPKRKPTS